MTSLCPAFATHTFIRGSAKTPHTTTLPEPLETKGICQKDFFRIGISRNRGTPIGVCYHTDHSLVSDKVAYIQLNLPIDLLVHERTAVVHPEVPINFVGTKEGLTEIRNLNPVRVDLQRITRSNLILPTQSATDTNSF